MVKVSIIVAVYNAEDYLKEALASIMDQTLEDIEIIVIDDGSTDNSFKILEEYAEKDKRFIILNQKNKGAGAARNTGLEHAHGEYLSFLDADDIFELDMLEKAYNKAKKLSLDLIIFGANDFKENLSNSRRAFYYINKRYVPKKEVFNYKDFPKYIFNAFKPWAWNKLFKQEFIIRNKIKFQEIHRTNDLLFTSKALIKAKRISVLDIPLVNYRIHVKSSQSTNDLYPKDFYHALLELKNFLINEGLFNSLKQSFINFVVSGCLYNLNSLTTQESYRELYNFLHETGLKELSINEVPENNYYKKGEYWKIKNILIINDPDEFNKLYHNKQSKIKKVFRSLFFVFKKEWKHPKRAINLLRAYRKIKKLNLFNSVYYTNKHPEAYSSKYNPIDYYMFYGYKKKHNPSEKFDSLYYTKKYPDIRASGENPLLHYVLHGQQEGRVINKEKDLDYKIWRINEKFNAQNRLLNVIIRDCKLEPQENLKSMQRFSLEFLKFIDKVCEKHSIDYWLNKNTLLGVINNNGFFPWDYDIDLGMMRKDYNNFISIIENEIKSNDLEKIIKPTRNYDPFCNYGSESEKTKTYLQFNYLSKNNENIRFFNILPYDYTNNSQEQDIEEIRNLETENYKKSRNSVNDSIYLSNNEKKMLKKISEKLDLQDTIADYMVPGVDSEEKFHIIMTKDIFPLKKINFENHKIKTPFNPQKYLTSQYKKNIDNITEIIKIPEIYSNSKNFNTHKIEEDTKKIKKDT